MPLWKQLLLNLYYHATGPRRKRRIRQWADEGHAPVIIFCWHRIADDRATPWSTPTATFIRQVEWLEKHFPFVSLADAQRRVRDGRNHQPCVSITFDDGYADNCRAAIPWLIERRIPCTYFVTLRNVLTAEPFPHDLALGQSLKPNNLEQLKSMASEGVEIGGHTDTHADLAAADPLPLRREIVDSKQELQAALGRPVRWFAFPFGQHANLSPAAFETAREAGYEAVCSAYGGYNFPGDDPFHLQRIVVDETMIHLKNWATMDPRKLRTRRYEYRTSESLAAASARRGKQDSTSAGSGIVIENINPTPPPAVNSFDY